ncbi:MAG TPA: hypothetical protein PLZ93_13605 [Nocardioides sp.]|uniref:hypothetical protein n=1 Tax=uncultured Nocardioides sp. TaxID=198441 RepID=UPI000EDCFA4D|nr:hypothetical protein [uncultured Nocardioides sp.]HCB03685.1 hypothetical protein [Nocardioides sp.]HRI96645.1 hypothetical protein [Nocardioides sp.]HRK46400.1 hypothetical protein [Nocardioides sp.]
MRPAYAGDAIVVPVTGEGPRVEDVADLPWGTIAAVLGTLLALRLVARGVARVIGVGYHEVHYRAHSGRLPTARR